MHSRCTHDVSMCARVITESRSCGSAFVFTCLRTAAYGDLVARVVKLTAYSAANPRGG